MTLVTGSAWGNVDAQEELYLEGSPYIYIQDNRATPLWNPDANGYYWGFSGTTTYPAYLLGCAQDVKMTEDVTLTMIRCDTVGDKAAIQRRNYIGIEFQLNSVLPLSIAAIFSNFNPATVVSGREYTGITKINNTRYYQIYMPKVYDDVNGYWIMAHFHRVQFTGNFTWSFGIDGWKVTGLRATALIDETKPASQMFGTIARFDASALP